MKKATIILIIAAVVCLLLFLCGCEGASTDANEPTRIASTETSQTEVTVLPPVSDYTGEGTSYTRDIFHARIVTPFGTSPGETIGKAEPFKVERGTTPAVKIGETEIAQAGGGSILGGGMRGGWLNSLWTDWIRPALFWYGGLLALSGILCFIPATAPFGSVMLRILLSPIPVVSAAVERGIAAVQAKKAATETATAEDQFAQTVAGVKAYADAHPDQKAALYAALAAKQDTSTQQAVAAVKSNIV